MDVGFYNKLPLLPLVLLWLAYAWLGWYLSAHHIIWLVGAFITALVIAVVWQSTSWLVGLNKFGSRSLVVALILSLSVALVGTWSIFSTFVLVPLMTTILAEIELRFAGFSPRSTILCLIVIGGLGLAVGEIVDIVAFPSSSLYLT